jgi:hypothetical protein
MIAHCSRSRSSSIRRRPFLAWVTPAERRWSTSRQRRRPQLPDLRVRGAPVHPLPRTCGRGRSCAPSCGGQRWPLAALKRGSYVCARCRVTSPTKRAAGQTSAARRAGGGLPVDVRSRAAEMSARAISTLADASTPSRGTRGNGRGHSTPAGARAGAWAGSAARDPDGVHQMQVGHAPNVGRRARLARPDLRNSASLLVSCERQPMARSVLTPWCQRTETRGPIAGAPTGEERTA